MFRLLTETDKEMTLNFLGKHPGLNLFQIGDIENHGFDSTIQTVWGSFKEDGTLRGVLLRYRENYIPYFEGDDFNVSEFMDVIKCDTKAKIISGEQTIVDEFLACFDEVQEKEMYFCELVDDVALKMLNQPIKVATPHDADRILNLLNTIAEFDFGTRTSSKSIKEKIEDGSGRVYYIENEKGDIICNVQTTAENSKSAMVVAVATHADYRELGLMSQTLSKLCQDLLSEGKTLCLFYDNEKAGSVYHKLGFKTIGKWKMLLKQARDLA